MYNPQYVQQYNPQYAQQYNPQYPQQSLNITNPVQGAINWIQYPMHTPQMPQTIATSFTMPRAPTLPGLSAATESAGRAVSSLGSIGLGVFADVFKGLFRFLR